MQTPFRVQINGTAPTDYAFRPMAASITYTMAFEEEQARLHAGISISEWDNLPGTRTWLDPEVGGRSKCDLIMLYRMSNWIPAAAQDASARDMERKQNLRKHG